ncbi:Hypothetical protein CAP_2573 [Chondromyces apiculatus DSM 436]|uniref:Uncharacterized protein n=1 Tax=Chondromyces apiculatus DSM 436 TaxID=1192034 RepID=A0A017TII2_9BACT|nr:Hypothetical protein CAP_2573 [Chondromyces apiculatus DSM 436]
MGEQVRGVRVPRSRRTSSVGQAGRAAWGKQDEQRGASRTGSVGW